MNIEDTTSPFDQRYIRRRKGLSNLCLHPGSMGFVVSNYAVCNLDLHGHLLAVYLPTIGRQETFDKGVYRRAEYQHGHGFRAGESPP